MPDYKDMTKIETLHDLRKRIAAWDGKTGTAQLQGDVALAIGLVPEGGRRGSPECDGEASWYYSDSCGITEWVFPSILTSLDAIDEITRKLAPGWRSMFMREDEMPDNFNVQICPTFTGGKCVEGNGPTEPRARLDALLAVLIFEG